MSYKWRKVVIKNTIKEVDSEIFIQKLSQKSFFR